MKKFASLAVVLSLFTGCLSSAQKTAFTGTFSACAKADVGEVVSSVEEQVSALIAANAAGLEAALTALATSVGIDTVDCAIAAVEALEGAGNGSGSATAPSTSAKLPGAIRADAWLKGWRAAHSKVASNR
jgi:hypothetical protein